MRPFQALRTSLALMLFVALGFFSPLAAQTTIGAGGGGMIQSYGKTAGEPNTQTYGQVITTPTDNILQTFSFWLGRTSTNYPDPMYPSLTFRAYVYRWNGTGVVGPAVFASATTQTHNASPDTPFTKYTFNTGGVALTVGQMYALFFSTSGEAGDGHIQWSTSPGDNYAGGSLIFANNGENTDYAAAEWYYGDWGGSNDMQFEATFSPVPEPATVLLFGTGLLGLAALGLRRRKEESGD